MKTNRTLNIDKDYCVLYTLHVRGNNDEEVTWVLWMWRVVCRVGLGVGLRLLGVILYSSHFVFLYKSQICLQGQEPSQKQLPSVSRKSPPLVRRRTETSKVHSNTYVYKSSFYYSFHFHIIISYSDHWQSRVLRLWTRRRGGLPDVKGKPYARHIRPGYSFSEVDVLHSWITKDGSLAQYSGGRPGKVGIRKKGMHLEICKDIADRAGFYRHADNIGTVMFLLLSCCFCLLIYILYGKDKNFVKHLSYFGKQRNCH